MIIIWSIYSHYKRIGNYLEISTINIIKINYEEQHLVMKYKVYNIALSRVVWFILFRP